MLNFVFFLALPITRPPNRKSAPNVRAFVRSLTRLRRRLSLRQIASIQEEELGQKNASYMGLPFLRESGCLTGNHCSECSLPLHFR